MTSAFSVTDRRILGIALPSIVSNITVPLLGLVDVAVTGHMGTEDTSMVSPASSYVGAIAVGGMLFNVIYWMFRFLRMGTGGETAQAWGRRDPGAVLTLLVRSLMLALILATGLMLASPWVCDAGLSFIAPEADVAALARTYYNICIWGAVPALSLFVLNGWYIGMQNSRIPMLVAIAQNVLNIVVSLLLVYVLRMRIEGVALGTVLAQWAALGLALTLWVRYYGRLWTRWHGRLPSFGRLLCQAISPASGSNRSNGALFLRTVCLVVVHFMFIAAGAAQGTVELAVNTLLMQFFTIFSYFMDGFAYAGEALVGKSIGAGNCRAYHDVVHRLFAWGGGLTILFVVLYGIGGESFMSLLTDDGAVLSCARDYRYWTLLLPVCGVASFLWDGIYIGATATRLMLLSMATGMVLFLAGYLWLVPVYGNHGLWLSFLAYLACRGLVQTWTRKKILPETFGCLAQKP